MKIKVTKSELFFYISYVIWISVYILKSTYFKDIESMHILFKLANIPIYGLLVLKFIFDNKYSIKTILAGVIFFILFVVSNNSSTTILIQMMLFIYSSRNMKFKDILKVTLITQIILMIAIVLSSLTGIIKNDVWDRENGSLRYGLGYTYCTHIANYFYHMVLMYLFLNENEKISKLSAVIILGLNIIIYMITDTKAVFYMITLLMGIIYILNYYEVDIKNNTFNRILLKYCFIGSAILSIGLSITYNASNKFYNFLDILLTGRLHLGKTAYEVDGISLFGQVIEWVTGRQGIERSFNSVYKFVDSSYLNIAINFGIVVLILVCIGYMIVMKKLIEENRVKECIVLLFLSLHSITDPQLLQLYYNPFLLIFGYLFYDDNKCYRLPCIEKIKYRAKL